MEKEPREILAEIEQHLGDARRTFVKALSTAYLVEARGKLDTLIRRMQN